MHTKTLSDLESKIYIKKNIIASKIYNKREGIYTDKIHEPINEVEYAKLSENYITTKRITYKE